MLIKLYTKAQEMLRCLRSDDSGATAIEYGLIAALIALAIVGGATALGGGLDEFFTNIAGSFPDIGGEE